MTWFAHKIVIFDIFKDVKAWGGETEKLRGETKQVLRNIFLLWAFSSAPFRRVAHNNDEKVGIYSKIALG